MHEFIYQDISHDLTNSEKYNLSIQVSLDGFSFLLQDASLQTISYLYHVSFSLSGVPGLVRKSAELLQHMQLAGRKFNQATVIIDNQHVKLIPSVLLTGKNLKSFFTVSHKESSHSEFIATPFDQDYSSVFLCHPDIIELFSTRFPGCIFLHESVPLLNHFRMKIIAETPSVIHCHFHSGYFLMFVLQGLKIVFFNTFNYNSPEDILYYLAAYFQTDEESPPVIRLSGSIGEGSREIGLLENYFPDVSIAGFNTGHLSRTGQPALSSHVIAPLLSNSGL